MKRTSRRPGFTLVELLVVIVIIGVLVGMLLPAVQAAREAARRTQCGNNLKQLGLAMASYESTVDCFPAGVIWTFGDGYPGVNFHVALFPYTEAANVFNQIDFNVSGLIWAFGNNIAATNAFFPYAVCPSDGLGGTFFTGYPSNKWARCNYFGVFSGAGYADVYSIDPTKLAIFNPNNGITPADIRDGLSNTMAMAEGLTGPPGDCRGDIWSTQPAGAMVFTGLTPNSPLPDVVYPYYYWCLTENALNRPCVLGMNADGDDETAAARSMHPGGVQVVMADGSVHFISNGIGPTVWTALGTIAGSEPPPSTLPF